MIFIDKIGGYTPKEASDKLEVHFEVDLIATEIVVDSSSEAFGQILVKFDGHEIILTNGDIRNIVFNSGTLSYAPTFEVKTSFCTFIVDLSSFSESTIKKNKYTPFIWSGQNVLFPGNTFSNAVINFSYEDALNQIYFNLRLLKTMGFEKVCSSIFRNVTKIGDSEFHGIGGVIDYWHSRTSYMFNYTLEIAKCIPAPFRIGIVSELAGFNFFYSDPSEKEGSWLSFINSICSYWGDTHLLILAKKALVKRTLFTISYEQGVSIADAKELFFSFSELDFDWHDIGDFLLILESAPEVSAVASLEDVRIASLNLMHYLKTIDKADLKLNSSLGSL